MVRCPLHRCNIRSSLLLAFMFKINVFINMFIYVSLPYCMLLSFFPTVCRQAQHVQSCLTTAGSCLFWARTHVMLLLDETRRHYRRHGYNNTSRVSQAPCIHFHCWQMVCIPCIRMCDIGMNHPRYNAPATL